ncbi:MAG: T9SS type A sorting domain-containing protein [Bacteroidota bacterium]
MEIRSIKWADLCLLWGLLLFGSSLQAQFFGRDGDDGSNGDANDAIVMDFEEGGGGDEGACAGALKFKVMVANLTSSPVLDRSYSLPRSLPRLYLSIDVPGLPLVVAPIDLFKFKGEYRRGAPIFEGYASRSISYEDFCENSADAPNMRYRLRLQTDNGFDYPIQENTDRGDVFSCVAFTFPTCSGDEGNDNSDNVAFKGTFAVNCTKCLDRIGISDVRSSSSSLEAQETNIHFSPNPFEAQLSVQLASQRVHMLTLRVLDVSGKQLYSTQIAPDAKDNYTIDASQWASGLYFFQVDSGDAIKTHKLIKSN